MGKQPKCTIQWKQSTTIKQHLEALFVAIKMCTGFIADVIWRNTRVRSVASEPSQSSSIVADGFRTFRTHQRF